MIFLFLILVISIVFYLFYFRCSKLSLLYLSILTIIPTTLILTNVFEVGEIKPVSDEIFYWFSSLNSELDEISKRFSWLFINEIIKNDLIYSDFIISKFINIPLILIFTIFLSVLLKDRKVALISVIMLPYLLVMATYNLRDIFALLLSILLILCVYSNIKLTFKFLLFSGISIILFSTRWFYLPVILISYLFVTFWPSGQNRLVKLFVINFISLIVIYLSYDYVLNNPWVSYLIDGGFYLRDESFVDISSGNFLYDSFLVF
ncbi:hypothetical protein CRG86_010170 [Photobacterium leiognathi]|nr:hypothetical protein CRG86_010170 [Photobacterium leiognathi]